MLRPTHDTLAAVWREESARVVAAVARRVRDVGVAEELAQDALVAALERWPVQGVPDRPGAWLMTTALNRALDWLRHRQMAHTKESELAQDLRVLQLDHVPDLLDALADLHEDGISDDVLRLVFTACHPVLAPDARAALALKLLGGFSTAEIARAYLVSESTMAQRVVRAKRTLRQANVAFELPQSDALTERLSSVLEVVYLIFNEGHSATAGDQGTRPDLCHEALRLGRLLAQISPDEPEVQGLLALMEIQASRLAARHDEHGRPVLLADQDRRLWNAAQIQRGLGALARAQQLANSPGPYQLQAALAACHARASSFADTDWVHMVALYDAHLQRMPSPVVALNRAVAVSMRDGPAAGLEIVEGLLQDQTMRRYPWLPAVQGNLLERLGRGSEARQALLSAAALAANASERAMLAERARQVSPDS